MVYSLGSGTPMLAPLSLGVLLTQERLCIPHLLLLSVRHASVTDLNDAV